MEIDDSFIAKVSAAITICGIVALLAFSFYSKPTKAKIGQIVSSDYFGGKYAIEGNITQSYAPKGMLILRVEEDNFYIKVVRFSATKEEVNLCREGSIAEATGELKEYEGEKEIVAEEIKCGKKEAENG